MSGGALRTRLYDAYVSSGQAASSSADAMIQELSGRMPYLRRLIARHFPAERTAAIVDIGCGYGALVLAAQQCGYANARGVDTSPEQVALAQRMGIRGVEQGDAMTYLTAQHGTIDAVVAFDVLEHLSKDEALSFGDAAFGALRNGGRFIVHVPNAESPFFGRVRYGDLTHELAFTPRSISSLLRVCGFRDVACYEEPPVAHGLKSAIRAVLWKFVRATMRFALAVETGVAPPIVTQNMLVVASKAQ